jgi:hypothetical protein
VVHTDTTSQSSGGLDPDHLSLKFMESACQYYVVARFAMHAQLMPVLGNLFHHAVEMALKTGLVKKRKLSELKYMGHNLKKLWGAFKVEFSGADLKRHDKTILRVNKYESIRYPDGILNYGAGMTADWFELPPEIKGHGGIKSPPQYLLVVSDIDDLMVDIFRACEWRLSLFIGGNPAALEAITRNNKHSEFLTRRVS